MLPNIKCPPAMTKLLCQEQTGLGKSWILEKGNLSLLTARGGKRKALTDPGRGSGTSPLYWDHFLEESWYSM